MNEEIQLVKELGQKIGYGHLMQLASSLWRKDLKDHNYPTIGAFVPRIDEKLDEDDLRYDRLIERI